MPTQAPETIVQNLASTALLARLRTVRAATLAFAEPLSPEDQMVQSCPEASPTKWHLAHTSWFFEIFVLSPYLPAYKPFHPDFHWLFNSYYNSLGDMPEKKLRASFSRPPLQDILAYRAHVDAAVRRLLAADPEEEALRRIALGLEHEQQHLELIATDIKHALFTNPLHPAYVESALSLPSSLDPLPSSFTSFPGGLTQIGISPDPTDPQAFAFDNETPRHTVFLQPFALANRLVTAAEYLAFINDNGYTRPELWLSEGWATQRAQAWEAPLYWSRDQSAQTGWKLYTLHGFRPLDGLLDTPVCHLSLFEADAFARWTSLTQPGCRLPTEFEWEHAAASAFPPLNANMLESAALHPTPAPQSPGLQQMFGDVWEWTSSGYTGYPGYHPLPGTLGEYNGKFMSSQVILRGGSCVTPATHIRPTYRNFFPPATRWQFSGLRLARHL
jgi:ergothioneine biosynthesis protein EgtB